MKQTLDWIVSVDDHIVEPPNVWTDRLPAKFRDIGPHIEKINGLDTWVYEDKHVPMTGIGAIVGKDIDDWNPSPVNFEDIHPSCYDARERLRCMDASGVLTQTLFPSFPRFCGQVFKEAENKELALLGVRAWNDYIIEEWAETYPGRFLPLCIVPLWDGKLAAEEAERAIAKGARGIIFSENASALGLPSIHDKGGFWDPLLSVANDSGLPICMHVGSSSTVETTAPDAPTVISFGLASVLTAKALFDWTFSGHFFRYPNLKIALSEGMIGWMPFAINWMDHLAQRQHWAWDNDFAFDLATGDYGLRGLARKIIDPERPPSELFKDHVYGCFLEDPVGIRLIDLIGVDNVMMETDFPHSDGTYPHSIDIARAQLAPLDDEAARKIATGNAARVFQFTPAPAPTPVHP